jgi:YfiH family protein
MHFFEVGGRRYAQFEGLRAQAGLAHAFSTRPFDVSVEDGGRLGACAARRRQMAIDFGFAPDKLRCCNQVHAARIAVVKEVRGARQLEGFDAAVTDVPGLALMTFSADCPLVLIYDSERRMLGMAHASWRCMVAALARRVVETMRERFGCEPASLYAGVGPSAGPARYEVKDDVYEAAAGLPGRTRFFQTRGGRLYLDLWEANRSQLEQAGVPRENVEVAGICTMSRTDLFYSYRQEGAECGHFGLLAGLRGPAREAP